MDLPYLYQLQQADYQSLEAAAFRVAVVDPDDTGLTAAQILDLRERQGKILYAYTSIGEAEDYRSYWQADWHVAPPGFLLADNAEWKGNYRVAFWEPEWRDIVLQRVDDAVAAGYDGVYLDIVDGYLAKEVIAAYPGTAAALRQEMVDFVTLISAQAKATEPDFAIIPQNAVGLLSREESSLASRPNLAYLAAIDGIGVEDLWYDGDAPADWTPGDLEMIGIAQRAGKFVLATSYPTESPAQHDFIDRALSAGLVPFVADRQLTGTIAPVNLGIGDQMAGRDINAPWTDGRAPLR